VDVTLAATRHNATLVTVVHWDGIKQSNIGMELTACSRQKIVGARFTISPLDSEPQLIPGVRPPQVVVTGRLGTRRAVY
jgi:hypothetical protein